MVEVEEVDREIRHMPVSQMLDLCSILDCSDGWKMLMSVIKNEDEPDAIKYSMEHIHLIETAGEKQKRSCTEILFEEWGTSGRRRPTYSTLLNNLIQCQLFRAAEYVHFKLLLYNEPLDRPTQGPAARVEIPDVDTVCKPSEFTTELTLINQASSKLNITDNSQGHPIISGTVPVSKISGYPKEYKYCDLAHWSEGFSKRLGHGAFGSVYLCNIPDPECQVAVKRLQMNSTVVPLNQLPNQFHNEITTLSMFNHENVLALLGFCCDGPELCLIYDYMPNGSLEDKIKAGSKELEWDVRLTICQGVAKGIHYLHTVTDKPHIHRDIKSANILLDHNITPKLGDFGLARPVPMETIATTTIVGTTAYMSPEAFRGDISIKMDIFSFGVVLLEIVTGLLAWDENRESRSLVSYIDDIDSIVSIIDRRPERPNDEMAMNLFNISQECLHEKKQNRPNIQQVLVLLLNLSP